MTSKSDPRGITTGFLYDSSWRLGLVKDNNLNILGMYRYAYQNFPESIIGTGITTPLAANMNYKSFKSNDFCFRDVTEDASVSVSGGSGYFSYSWSLKNNTLLETDIINQFGVPQTIPAGTILQNAPNSISSLFTYKCPYIGNMTVQCIITDLLTNQNVSVGKVVNCYNDFFPLMATYLKYTFLDSGSASISIPNNEGSGDFLYGWSYYPTPPNTIIPLIDTKDFTFKCWKRGILTLTCTITDNVTGKTKRVQTDITVQ
jgi:hypothetical protein